MKPKLMLLLSLLASLSACAHATLDTREYKIMVTEPVMTEEGPTIVPMDGFEADSITHEVDGFVCFRVIAVDKRACVKSQQVYILEK